MAFDIIYQLRTKKFWWLDTILYFALAMLIATVIVYFIFSIKISLQEKKIQELKEDIATTGIPQQKELEVKVFEYQKKINDFSVLFTDHKIPSNILHFIEESAFPNAWFSLFSLNVQEDQIKLSGEIKDALVLARQVSLLKENEFVNDVKLLNFSLGEQGKVIFNLTFSLDSRIFKQ